MRTPDQHQTSSEGGLGVLWELCPVLVKWGRSTLLHQRQLCPDSVEEVGVRAADERSPKQLGRSSQPVSSGRGTRLASFLRFCAVAASWNCSYAPFGPRSRIIDRPMYRFRCAKSISTFRL